MAALCPPVKFQAFDNNGDPAVGYKLFTYETGTTTNKATFTDAAGTTPNTNPVVFDARGEITLFLAAGEQYRVVLKTAADVTVWTQDGVSVGGKAGNGMSVSVAGVYTVVAANATISVSSSGVAINLGNANTWTALQSHSVGINVGNSAQASATTLDWYQEGTFTPTIVGLTSAGAGTYAIQDGSYTRIGNRVFFSIVLSWSAHTGTGFMQVQGLPFTSAAGSIGTPLSVYNSNLLVGAGLQFEAVVAPASTSINIYGNDSSGGAGSSITMDTSGAMVLAGHYRV